MSARTLTAGAVKAAHILVVDDEPLIRETLEEYLAQEGYQVSTCASGEQALELAANHPFDIVLCDVQLPGLDGMETLERLLQVNPQSFVLLVTAYATVENAIEAFQRGAHDYLMKPIVLDEVSAKLRRILEYRNVLQENDWLRRQVHREYDFEHIVGRGPAMQRVFEMVRRLAPTRSTVLLWGESGSGKELIARALHFQGKQQAGRFLAVNCAAIPHDLLENQLFGHRKGAFTGADRDQAGIFAHAGDGTVFLDEICELPLATQAKLLGPSIKVMPVSQRADTSRPVSSRQRTDLLGCRASHFREDLYYRLNVVSILLPPCKAPRGPGAGRVSGRQA